MKCNLQVYCFVLLTLCLFACNRRFTEEQGGASDSNTTSDTETDKVHLATAINIYIENSGSMNGYVNGNTEFKDCLRDLLVMLNNYYGEDLVHLKFVNSLIYPMGINGKLVDIPSKLNAKSFKVGNTASSELNSVFEQVLANTSRDTLSILLSDCIYSIEKGDTGGLLNAQKSLTKNAFLTKFKNDTALATVIVKLSSIFNGTYYDKNNQKTYLSKGETKRPYYLVILGDETAVADFGAKIPLSKDQIKGYEAKHSFTAQDFSDGFYYSIVQTTQDIGVYKKDRNTDRDKNHIRSIEDVRVSKREMRPFTFSVAVDLQKIPLENDYIQNTDNYRITSGNYELASVHAYDPKDLTISSSQMIRNAGIKPTHYFVFRATSKQYTNLTFALEKKSPIWINETHTEDDTAIRQSANQTFGFRYLMEGISDAYSTKSLADHYFEVNLNIKK